jgi:hypothetical protein
MAFLTMERRRQPGATHGNRFRLFLRVSRPSDFRPVATTGLHKGSILLDVRRLGGQRGWHAEETRMGVVGGRGAPPS